MKTIQWITVAVVALVGLTMNAQGQEKRFGFELSGDASLATRQLGGATLNTGNGFEGIFHYRFYKHMGIYAGWGWNHFAADESFAGSNMDFEETGYVFGLQFKHPLGTSRVSYYLRAAGLYNHIEIENAHGDIIHDTGHGMGYQLAGGMDLPMGSGWSFTPGVRYNALSRELKSEDIVRQLDLNYLSLRIGFLKYF